MIYRPAPVTEIKAQTIENIIRREIMADRKGGRTRDFLNSVDSGLELGQGCKAAIQRRILFLKQQQQELLFRIDTASKLKDKDKDEIDIMEDI